MSYTINYLLGRSDLRTCTGRGGRIGRVQVSSGEGREFESHPSQTWYLFVTEDRLVQYWDDMTGWEMRW